MQPKMIVYESTYRLNWTNESNAEQPLNMVDAMKFEYLQNFRNYFYAFRNQNSQTSDWNA